MPKNNIPILGHISEFLLGVIVVFSVVEIIDLIRHKEKFTFNLKSMACIVAPILIGYMDLLIAKSMRLRVAMNADGTVSWNAFKLIFNEQTILLYIGLISTFILGRLFMKQIYVSKPILIIGSIIGLVFTFRSYLTIIPNVESSWLMRGSLSCALVCGIMLSIFSIRKTE